MQAQPFAAPRDVGFDPARLQRTYDILQQWTEKDQIPAATICVGRDGRAVEPRFFGRQGPDQRAARLRPDALFLTASITKPVTVTALMMLVERGLLTLEDRVARFVPRFAANGKQDVQIRHLMTHTSGLPDMLPNNDMLRGGPSAAQRLHRRGLQAAAAVSAGHARSATRAWAPPCWPRSCTRSPAPTCPSFCGKRSFGPLGMNDTSLGLQQPERRERIAAVRFSAEQQKTDWNWNSPYWLGFGAPWGGMITSPADFARFCLMMLGGGSLGDTKLLSQATVRAMTANQLAAMPQVPEEDRRCKPWGLGWRLNWPAHSANFGDLLGPRTFGHWGATGTLCWMDPDSSAFLILFTTQPQEPDGRFLARISNLVAAAMV